MPPESLRLERMRRSLLDLFSRWGYEIVTPPFIEYLESLLTGHRRGPRTSYVQADRSVDGPDDGGPRGHDSAGRPHRRPPPAPRRPVASVLCRARSCIPCPKASRAGAARCRSERSSTATSGCESDCEIVCLMLEALELSGIGPVHLGMGHVGIFRALARRAALSHEQEITLHEALQRKAGSEVRELLDAWEVDARCAAALIALVDLDGDPSVLERAGRDLAGGGEEVERGLADLAALVRAVRARRPDVELHVDLAELRGIPLPHRFRVRRVRAGVWSGSGEGWALRRDRQRLRSRAGGHRIQRGSEDAHRVAGIRRRRGR